MSEYAALLRRFQPRLKYDSNEAFFADSASEWTDNPGNLLRRVPSDGHPGEVVAAASPQTGEEQLSLDTLGDTHYPTSQPVERDDLITAQHRNYREMYVALRQRPGYANRMYGRAQQDSSGRLWLQYWFFYFYNDYSLAGGIGLHEGDWEMVQFRMAPAGERPDLAVYAQHRHAEKATWEEVEKLAGTQETPLVYVARGSHASYFAAGYHETEAWYDIADGKRKTPMLELEIVGDDVPGWLRWPGSWGGTRPRVPGVDQPSPHGPSDHKQWHDPKILVADAKTHARPAALPVPDVRARRSNGRLMLEFDFSRPAGSRPERLVVTVNSGDDKLPPRTFTFALEPALTGTIETRVELREPQHYDIYISTVDKDGRPSESRLELIDPVGAPAPLSERILPRVGGLVARIRRIFG